MDRQNDAQRILGQIERGEVRADAEAAREIAQKIEDDGGFWGPRLEDQILGDKE